MNEVENKLLRAIHAVDSKVTSLESKFDNGITIKYQEYDRRIGNLESLVKWFSLLIIGGVLASLMALVIV